MHNEVYLENFSGCILLLCLKVALVILYPNVDGHNIDCSYQKSIQRVNPSCRIWWNAIPALSSWKECRNRHCQCLKWKMKHSINNSNKLTQIKITTSDKIKRIILRFIIFETCSHVWWLEKSLKIKMPRSQKTYFSLTSL